MINELVEIFPLTGIFLYYRGSSCKWPFILNLDVHMVTASRRTAVDICVFVLYLVALLN